MRASRWISFGLTVLLGAGYAAEIRTTPGWFATAPAPVEASPSVVALTEPGSTQPAIAVRRARLLTLEPPSIAEAITPEIEALARGLENDPARIYNYVHDHIRFLFYYGSKKGAHLTLMERSGNDFDQCALLVALLRAAGYSNCGYQYGFMRLPYEAADHKDIRHWLRLTVPGTDLAVVHSYLKGLAYPRGFSRCYQISDGTYGLQRLWVTLTLGGTNYYLDPAFKVSEPVTGVNLASAMTFNDAALMSAAGGTTNTFSVSGLSEASVRATLTGCTSNLLAWLQANAHGASVDEVLGGQRIVPRDSDALDTATLFPTWTNAGMYPIQTWDNQPVAFMSTLTVGVAGASNRWYTPELQGKCLSLAFDASGVATLCLDTNQIFSQPTSGGDFVDATFTLTHPYGGWDAWDTTNAVPIDTGVADAALTRPCKRSGSFYSMVYSYDPSLELLRWRQRKLEEYLGEGRSESSREVVCETLNVLGLNFALQYELSEGLLCQQTSMSHLRHHMLGRAAQEAGAGYYIDIFENLNANHPASGYSVADAQRRDLVFDVGSYFGSAFEHATIEQLQSTNLVAASTIKVLQLANTNALTCYLTDSNNWTSVRGNLTGYDLGELDGLVNSGHALLLPSSGTVFVGDWRGDGYVSVQNWTNGYRLAMSMMISGGYNGGYSGDDASSLDPWFAWWSADLQEGYDYGGPALQPDTESGDPVDMANAGFCVDETDLAAGGPAPQGLALSRAYSSALRRQNPAGLGYGWTHSYCFSADQLSSPQLGLGATTPQQVAPMLVATCAALSHYTSQPDPKRWMVTALIAKWGIDQLIKSSVAVTLGKDTIHFMRQPDGSYTPPGNCTMSLSNSSSGYNLYERHGRTFKFDLAGRLTNLVDNYNQALSLTYLSTNSHLPATVSDWKSRTLTFNYSGTPERLVSVTNNGTGRRVIYGYVTNALGQADLTSVTDPESQTSTFQYDTNHQIVASLDALNQLVVSNLYDAFGRVTTQYTQGDTNKMWRIYWSGDETVQQDPMGSKTRFYYDDRTRLIAVEDPLGNTSEQVYDGQDRVVMTLSPMNETNRFIYDANHNLTQSVDPLDQTNRFYYDNAYNLLYTVDALGNSNRFGYNSHYQMTASTNGAGEWVHHVYDGTTGLLTSRTDAVSTNTFGYDANGYLNSVTYPAGLGSESFVNNVYGDVTSYTDARQQVTTFQYDQRRQLTNTVASLNRTNVSVFDAVGNLIKAKDARGATTTNYWSPTRKLTRTDLPATPQGVPTISQYYDSRDWLTRTVDPLSRSVRFTNDVAGRRVSLTDPLLRTSFFAYDADGRQTSSTNGALEVTRQEYSARGEPVRTVDNANRSVWKYFDAAGRQTLLTNRNGKTWQFRYDNANRLYSTVTPRGFSNYFVFDAVGRLFTAREPSAQMTTNQYDARSRLTNVTDAAGVRAFRYDENGNRTHALEGSKSNVWTFDAADRVSTYQDSEGNLIQYAYDQNGNLTNLVYPGARAVRYSYDALNRLTSMTDWANRQTSFEYDLANRLTSIRRPNGTVRSIGYDAAGETTNITEMTAGNVPITAFKLEWNAAARVQREWSGPPPHRVTPPTRTATYDDDNRIATFNGQSVVYDADGNLTSAPLTNATLSAYGYDARNRLLSAGGLSYTYDPAGNRVAVTNAGVATKYVVNPNAPLSQVLMRIRPGVTNFYVHGLGLLYEVTETASSTNVLTHHFDYRGSTVALTDSAGNVTDRAEYSAYGLLTYRGGTTDTPFLFNGRYGVMTDANGLLYMRARYYNPYLCRFLNPDPAGFTGGLNFFCFADGNPVSLLDPFGLGAVGEGGLWSWVKGAVKGAVGWTLDQLYDTPASVAGAANEIAATALDAYGAVFCNDPNLGKALHDAARLNFASRGMFAKAGYYNPNSGTTMAANVVTLFMPFGSKAAAGKTLFAAETTLYRAVGPAELADIQANNILRNLGSAEGKYFTTSAEAASSYARQAVRGFGDPPYTLIQTRVPNSIFEGLTPATVDRGIPAWVIPNNRLPGLVPEVLPIMPIPRP